MIGLECAMSENILRCQYLISFMLQRVHCGKRSDSVIRLRLKEKGSSKGENKWGVKLKEGRKDYYSSRTRSCLSFHTQRKLRSTKSNSNVKVSKRHKNSMSSRKQRSSSTASHSALLLLPAYHVTWWWGASQAGDVFDRSHVQKLCNPEPLMLEYIGPPINTRDPVPLTLGPPCPTDASLSLHSHHCLHCSFTS